MHTPPIGTTARVAEVGGLRETKPTQMPASSPAMSTVTTPAMPASSTATSKPKPAAGVAPISSPPTTTLSAPTSAPTIATPAQLGLGL